MSKLIKAGKHSCLGALQSEDVSKDDSSTMLERSAMLVYCGKFDSMDGPVEISEQTIDLMIKSHENFTARLKRMFVDGDIPVRLCPPLQVDHSPSATMTVGRIVGRLYKGVYTNPAGENVPALFADRIRVLGAENVEKVADGRWADLSIGADLETGKLNEVSITPFPAAPGATLLKRLASHNGVEYEIKEVEPGEFDIFVAGMKVTHHAGTVAEVDAEAKRYIEHEKNEEGEQEMPHEKLKKHLMEHKKLSEKEAEELSKKMHEHHMKHMGLDEEKMSKHLEAADDKEMSRMSDEYDKHLKHLAEKPEDKEEDKEKEKKMTAARDGFKKLALGIKSSTTELKSEIKLASINAGISRLRKAGKITPAEIKKLDLTKLSSMSTEAYEAALATFDLREPVIEFGNSFGTTKADAIEKVARRYRMQRLELESRLNMPSKKVEAQAMLAKLAEEEKNEVHKLEKDEEPSKGMLTKVGYEELCKMLEDKDKHEDLKKHLKHFVDMAGVEMPADGDDKRMSAIANKHAELQNRFNELVSIVAPVLGIKEEELNK